MLPLRAKTKEEDDTSEEDPGPPEESRAARTSKEKEAKEEEEHRSSKDTSSSSEDRSAELFRRCRSRGQLGEQGFSEPRRSPQGLCRILGQRPCGDSSTPGTSKGAAAGSKASLSA